MSVNPKVSVPALSRTIEDYCALRAELLDHYAEILDRKKSIESTTKEIGGNAYSVTANLSFESGEKFRQDVDRFLWRHTMERTGIPRYMDDKARKEFEKGLERDPPLYTYDSVRSTLMTAASEAPVMLYRGVYELFSRLNGRYRSHDPFKIKKRMVVQFCTDAWRMPPTLSYERGSVIDDLERVLAVIHETPYKECELRYAINEAWKQGGEGGPWVYDDGIVKVRGFKNKSAHIYLLQQEDIDAVNLMIGKHCENAIPDGRSETRKQEEEGHFHV